MNKRIKIPIKIVLALGIGFIFAFFLQFFFSKDGINSLSEVLFGDELTGKDYFGLYKESLNFSKYNVVACERVVLLSIVFGFVILHLLFGIKKTFDVVFRYRWLFGAVILCFLVLGRYNGNPLDSYESIQYGMGTEYELPVIGFETPNRSDEVLVNTASKMYYYNKGLPGEELTAANIIQNPLLLVVDGLLHTAGRDYAYSLDFYFYIILAFLVSIELFLIITGGKRLLSIASTFMIYLSTFYLWWGVPSNLLNVMGITVSLYYCINTKKLSYRAFFGLATAFFSVRFVFSLYPAWQVPLGFALLPLMVWVVTKGWTALMKFNKYDWIVAVCSILIMLVGLYICYVDRQNYISSITKTVYPGERRDYGGYAMCKLYNYISGALFWLKKPAVMSENGTIINLFPIPFALSIYYLIKSKKKDILLVGLCLTSVLLILYCSNGGLSKTVADFTLLSNATPWRAVDIIGYIQVIMFARVFSLYKCDVQEEIVDESKRKRLRVFIILLASIAIAVYSVHMADRTITEYLPHLYKNISAGVLVCLFYFIISSHSYAKYKMVSLILIGISIFTGFIIRPIRKGTDVIFSKPVASVIEQIEEENPDSVWITYGSLISQSYVKCFGADVVNYVNTTPNMKLWTSLDPIGEYNEVYNRYAHVVVDFSDGDTWFELVQTDYMNLHIAYRDLWKTGADYLFAQNEVLADEKYFTLDCVYNDGGVIIYKINYTDTN